MSAEFEEIKKKASRTFQVLMYTRAAIPWKELLGNEAEVFSQIFSQFEEIQRTIPNGYLPIDKEQFELMCSQANLYVEKIKLERDKQDQEKDKTYRSSDRTYFLTTRLIELGDNKDKEREIDQIFAELGTLHKWSPEDIKNHVTDEILKRLDDLARKREERRFEELVGRNKEEILAIRRQPKDNFLSSYEQVSQAKLFKSLKDYADLSDEIISELQSLHLQHSYSRTDKAEDEVSNRPIHFLHSSKMPKNSEELHVLQSGSNITANLGSSSKVQVKKDKPVKRGVQFSPQDPTINVYETPEHKAEEEFQTIKSKYEKVQDVVKRGEAEAGEAFDKEFPEVDSNREKYLQEKSDIYKLNARLIVKGEELNKDKSNTVGYVRFINGLRRIVSRKTAVDIVQPVYILADELKEAQGIHLKSIGSHYQSHIAFSFPNSIPLHIPDEIKDHIPKDGFGRPKCHVAPDNHILKIKVEDIIDLHCDAANKGTGLYFHDREQGIVLRVPIPNLRKSNLEKIKRIVELKKSGVRVPEKSILIMPVRETPKLENARGSHR